MPPRKKSADAAPPSAPPAPPETYGKSLVDEHKEELEQLRALVMLQSTVPDDVPAGISLRDAAVLHLVATAELHRYANDVPMQRHRISRCIEIANLVVQMLEEDNGKV